jgi:hypothetical protein
MAFTYTKIQTITTTSGNTTVDFTSIPSIYQDLAVFANTRYSGATAGNWYDYKIEFNGITTGLKDRFLYASSSSFTSQQDASEIIIRHPGKDANAANFGTSNWYIPNYNSSDYKSAWAEGGQQGIGSSSQIINASVGTSTLSSAITSIRFKHVDSGAFTAGSTFTLYGIAAN